MFNQPARVGQEPRIDLYEDDDHFFVRSELPGVSKSDVNVALVEGVLTISGSVSRETTDGRKNMPLKRSITLPDQVGDGEVRAKLEDGILTVTLPKAEITKPRSIEIE